MAANTNGRPAWRLSIVVPLAAFCVTWALSLSTVPEQTPSTPQQKGPAVAPVQKPAPTAPAPPKAAPGTVSEQLPSPSPEVQPQFLQEKPQGELPEPTREPLNLGSYARKTLVSLLLVIALLCLFFVMLKRITRGFPIFLDQKTGRVIGTIPLGARAALYLVKIANRVLVVGVSPATVTLVTEITDPETVQKLERGRHEGGTARLPFGSYLSQSRAGFSGDQKPTEEEAKLEEHLRDIKDQMAKLSALIGGSEGEKER